MSEITDRIKALCAGKGVSIKRFEQDCGLSNGYFSAIRRYNSMPSADKLNTIAQYFGVSRDYLLGKEEKTESVGVMIPLLGRVAAGVPISAVENIIGQEEISRSMAITGEFFALRIKGDSMSPYIMDGDIVVVRQQNDAESGDVVIALVNGNDGVCKRFKRIDGGIMLTSVNPQYDPIIFTHSEIDSVPVYIMGKVIEIRRSV
jgi:repressor LexA